jgi:hypothetical protein
MLKSKKLSRGRYEFVLHGHTFTLEKLSGDINWRLYNAKDTEVNCCETKAGLLEALSTWSVETTQEAALQDFCNYA